jgi:hypothetical protein
MDLSQIPLLTTAIAIIIAWALFALFCSYLHEAFAQIIAERGRFLKMYLLKQLKDLPNGINWALLVYQHGTIDLLTRDPKKPSNDIDPTLFARTLIEVSGKAHLVQSQLAKLPAGPVYKNELLSNFAAATQLLMPSDVISMFKQSLADAELKATVNGVVDESKLYDALVANIMTWYTEFLQRVTLWYKKITRQRLFILGVLIAAVINVDSVQLFQQFSSNPASKNALIAYYTKNKAQLEAQADALKDTSIIAKRDLKTVTGQIDTTEKSLAKLSASANLPIGISKNLAASLSDDWRKRDLGGALSKLLGILITGFAASFGAPFWFDFLKKIYTINPKS